MTPIIGVIDSSKLKSTTAFDSIATLNLSGVTNATFSSIPSTYKSLQIRFLGVAVGGEPRMLFNGDTGNNYVFHSVCAYNNGVNNVGQGAINYLRFGLSNQSAFATMSNTFPTVAIVDIDNYASTTLTKVVRHYGGTSSGNLANSESTLGSGLWNSTSAITSINIGSGGVTFATGSTVALYGIKG